MIRRIPIKSGISDRLGIALQIFRAEFLPEEKSNCGLNSYELN